MKNCFKDWSQSRSVRTSVTYSRFIKCTVTLSFSCSDSLFIKLRATVNIMINCISVEIYNAKLTARMTESRLISVVDVVITPMNPYQPIPFHILSFAVFQSRILIYAGSNIYSRRRKVFERKDRFSLKTSILII